MATVGTTDQRTLDRVVTAAIADARLETRDSLDDEEADTPGGVVDALSVTYTTPSAAARIFLQNPTLASSEASRDRQARCQAVRGESLIFPHVEDPADCPLDLFYSE
jgi:hypothetical protein